MDTHVEHRAAVGAMGAAGECAFIYGALQQHTDHARAKGGTHRFGNAQRTRAGFSDDSKPRIRAPWVLPCRHGGRPCDTQKLLGQKLIRKIFMRVMTLLNLYAVCVDAEMKLWLVARDGRAPQGGESCAAG